MNRNQIKAYDFDEFKSFISHVTGESRKKVINEIYHGGKTFLTDAIKNYKLPLVKLLLSDGADTNLECGKKFRKTPLYYVIKYELVDILKLLLKYGLDVDKRFGIATNIFGFTCTEASPYQVKPLIYAIYIGNAEIVKLILQNSQSGRVSPFFFTSFYNISSIQYVFLKYNFTQLKIYKALIKRENGYITYSNSDNGNYPENVNYTVFGRAVIFNQLKIVKWILKYKNDLIPKNFMEYHLNIYGRVDSMEMLRLFIKYDSVNKCSVLAKAPLDKIVKSETDDIELRKYASGLFPSQMDVNDYIATSSFLKNCMRRNVIKNFTLVLLGFNFDEKCLFYNDYLSRDMFLLILKEAKNSAFH